MSFIILFLIFIIILIICYFLVNINEGFANQQITKLNGFKPEILPTKEKLSSTVVSYNAANVNDSYYISEKYYSSDNTVGFVIKNVYNNNNNTQNFYFMFIFKQNKNVNIFSSYDGKNYQEYKYGTSIKNLKTDMIINNFKVVKDGNNAKTFEVYNNGVSTYSIVLYNSENKAINVLYLRKTNTNKSEQNYWGVNSVNYDNYNHYTRNSIPTIYYGNTGETAKIIENNGVYVMIITDKNGNTYNLSSSGKIYSPIIINENKNNTNNNIVNKNMTYYGLNGEMATFINTNNGYVIKVVDSNGKTTFYNSANNQTLDPDYINNASYGTVSGNFNKLADYSTSLPKGVSGNDITKENENLYMLKTQIVPPVCPASNWGSQGGAQGGAQGGVQGGVQGGAQSLYSSYYPQPSMTSTSINGDNKCQPCAPCGRCPEPSFECKKVPNYNSKNNEYLPMPVLNSFSTFGM